MKIIIILGLIFVWRVQPYIIIIRIIVITVGYSIYLYYRIGRYWYRYILVLVIIRGVLVLFRYIARLIPNERFEYLILIYVRLFVYFVILIKFKYGIIYFGDIRVIVLKIWEMIVRLYNLYIVLFLLIIMVIVVWVRNFGCGAVRNY